MLTARFRILLLFHLLMGAAEVIAQSPAAPPEVLSGAFGLHFDVPVPEEVLGASSVAPAELPHRPFDDEYAEASPGWFQFSPRTVPDPLQAARYDVLVTADHRPALILSRLANAQCEATYAWLVESLTRK